MIGPAYPLVIFIIAEAYFTLERITKQCNGGRGVGDTPRAQFFFSIYLALHVCVPLPQIEI